MKRMMAVFAAAILSLVLGASSAAFAASAPAPAPKPENQPEMVSALEHLREAKRALESASRDKGGHRAKAIALINDAIRQVEEGIQYDNTHTSPGERKH
ncbi:MAG: hypothetical protein LAO03_10360 [Acidobacteriia bacterium]|nr:hypothetical protein [Terriglobia bacterium]